MNFVFMFLLTFIAETIVYFIFLKDWKRIILYCFLINLFTWPLANLFQGFWNVFWLIELGVFLIEGLLIKLMLEIGWKRALAVSFVANLLTAGIGLFFF